MKLHYALPSPYVRKVRAVAIELGLDGRIELLERAMTPVSPNAALNADNPLGKIPCLITDDGEALYDSRVICSYLDSLVEGKSVYAKAGAARWTALRREALADGILDAAVGRRYETFLRPAERQWDAWIDGQRDKFTRGLDQFEREAAGFGDAVDIGTIAAACACGYMDFRYADEAWRDTRPTLAAWYETFSKRPSIATTAPE
ncbi:MAG: glutathione S-transferase [Alphaproteobacteria bacterium]|nr:glutathione S-transferase [Alphaproteobacteria bacterium]